MPSLAASCASPRLPRRRRLHATRCRHGQWKIRFRRQHLTAKPHCWRPPLECDHGHGHMPIVLWQQLPTENTLTCSVQLILLPWLSSTSSSVHRHPFQLPLEIIPCRQAPEANPQYMSLFRKRSTKRHNNPCLHAIPAV